MSKLNINRNIFLEREELLRWQDFLVKSNVNQVFLANTTAWGIIDTSGGGSPDDFKVEVGTNSGTIKIANLSRALDSSGLLIKQEVIDNVPVPGGGFHWVKISHIYSKLEKGTCSITIDGQVAGTGTFFTEVLRGQSTEVPVRVKFPNSVNNTGTYEVVSVSGDNNIILSGESFSAESNLNYVVIGSIPLGDTVTSSQEDGLYFYDSCKIDFIYEPVLDTEPGGKVQGSEFWIARVLNNSGNITIEDKRSEYWEYYIRGVTNKLDKDKNLSDVGDKGAARGNLDVYSKSEVDNLVGVDETQWLTLAKGANVANDNLDVKIKRLGKFVNITGTFRLSSSPPANAVLFSIAYSSIGAGKASPNNRIHYQMVSIETENLNHGLRVYIPIPQDPSTPVGNLEIKFDPRSYVPSSSLASIYSLNITYISG